MTAPPRDRDAAPRPRAQTVPAPTNPSNGEPMSLSRTDLVVPRLTRRRAERLFAPRDLERTWEGETGAATAEYAIATMAIVARLGQT